MRYSLNPRTRRLWKPGLEALEGRNLLAAVNPLLFGLNQPWSDGDSWLDFDDDPKTTTQGEATRDAVRRLGVRSLRYVGGTVSTFWDWWAADWVSDDELRAFGPTVYQGQAGRRDRFQAQGMGGPDGFYSP